MPIYKVVISGLIIGQLWQNRIWVQSESFQDASEVANQIDNFWVERIRELQINNVQYQSIHVQQFGEAVNQSFNKAINKTGAQSPESQIYPFACGLIRFNTAISGRRGRGRYYVCGFRGGAVELGRFKQSELDFWAQRLEILSAAFLGDNSQSGIALMIRGEEPNVHNTLVTNMQMTPIIRVQRRRNIGVGA